MLDEEDRGRITYPVRHIRIGLVLLHPQTLLGRQEDSGVAPWNPQSSHMLHGEGVGVWRGGKAGGYSEKKGSRRMEKGKGRRL